MKDRKLKEEFFRIALAITVSYLIVLFIPLTLGETADAFHKIGLFIIIGLWALYLVFRARENNKMVLVVIENIESPLLKEIISNSGINPTNEDVKHLSNMENWELKITQKDYEKICDYISRHSSRYRGRVYKREE